MTTTIPATAAAALLLATLLGLGGWLLAQSRDEHGQPRTGTTRLGTLLAALGLLLGVLSLPPTLPPLTLGLLLLAVLALGLLLLRGAATRAQGWTSLGEAFTTAVGLAWASPRRAVVSLCCLAAGLGLTAALGAAGEPLAALLGAALVLAPARWWWQGAWQRETLRTRCELALAGLLSGGLEWDPQQASRRGAPVRTRFAVDGSVARVTAPLPPAWTASRTEDLEAEITARLGFAGPAWVVTPDPGRRIVTVTPGTDLPQTVAYPGPEGAQAEIVLGPARVSREAAVAGLGAFGSGFAMTWDLAVAPHGLVVGLTGSGKSVIATVVIASWCAKGNAAILLDPKRVEFTPFRGRKGVRQVETELEQIVEALEASVAEMEERYRAMAAAGVRKTDALPKAQRPTRLLIVVDEVFELLAKRGGTDDTTKEINAMKARAASAILSIAALGRAAGVHLLLLCQRADRAVVEGPLQNNLPMKVLCQPATSQSTERNMIGLQEVTVSTAVPGRAVGRAIGIPESEFQAYYLDDDDLDRWLPVVDEAAVVRPRPLTESERSLVLVREGEAAPGPIFPEAPSEGEAWERAAAGAGGLGVDPAPHSDADSPTNDPAPAHDSRSGQPHDPSVSAPESSPTTDAESEAVSPENPSETTAESAQGETPKAKGRGPRLDWDFMADFDGDE